MPGIAGQDLAVDLLGLNQAPSLMMLNRLLRQASNKGGCASGSLFRPFAAEELDTLRAMPAASAEPARKDSRAIDRTFYAGTNHLLTVYDTLIGAASSSRTIRR